MGYKMKKYSKQAISSKILFLSDFDILNFIVFVRVKFH